MSDTIYKIWNKKRQWIICGFLFFLIIGAFGNFDNTWWKWVDAGATALTLVLVFFDFIQRKQGEDEIDIIFIVSNGERYRLKLPLKRRDITRSEIQGILSNYQKDSTGRYNIAYLSEIEYLEQIYKIQDNNKESLEIKVAEKEFIGYKKDERTEYTGFDIDKLEKLS